MINNLPVPSRQQAPLLEKIIRHRVGESSALRLMVGASSEQAVEKSMKRLKSAGWLQQIALPDRKCCYTLSRRAVLELGLSKKAKKAMGQGAVIANLAMMFFCARSGVERLTQDEIRSAFPDLDRPGLQIGNYFTNSSVEPARLTWMLVDRGFSPPVLVHKAEKIIRKAHDFASLHELMANGQFGVVLLVPNERKKWLVDQVIEKRYFARVTVSVDIVPETQDLLLS